jgi:hypothetical protein
MELSRSSRDVAQELYLDIKVHVTE